MASTLLLTGVALRTGCPPFADRRLSTASIVVDNSVRSRVAFIWTRGRSRATINGGAGAGEVLPRAHLLYSCQLTAGSLDSNMPRVREQRVGLVQHPRTSSAPLFSIRVSPRLCYYARASPLLYTDDPDSRFDSAVPSTKTPPFKRSRFVLRPTLFSAAGPCLLRQGSGTTRYRPASATAAPTFASFLIPPMQPPKFWSFAF